MFDIETNKSRTSLTNENKLISVENFLFEDIQEEIFQYSTVLNNRKHKIQMFDNNLKSSNTFDNETERQLTMKIVHNNSLSFPNDDVHRGILDYQQVNCANPEHKFDICRSTNRIEEIFRNRPNSSGELDEKIDELNRLTIDSKSKKQ